MIRYALIAALVVALAIAIFIAVITPMLDNRFSNDECLQGPVSECRSG